MGAGEAWGLKLVNCFLDLSTTATAIKKKKRKLGENNLVQRRLVLRIKVNVLTMKFVIVVSVSF